MISSRLIGLNVNIDFDEMTYNIIGEDNVMPIIIIDDEVYVGYNRPQKLINCVQVEYRNWLVEKELLKDEGK